MRLFPPELEISPDEGFTPEKDIFGRKSFGDQLTKIILALENPGVLLLDAPWGTGKTIFLKMWQGALMKDGIRSVYFDAFANDYQADAFLAVASQIIAEADSLKHDHATVLGKFTTKAVQVAKVIGRGALGVGIRAATAGLVASEDLRNAAADIAKDAGAQTAKVIDEAIKARLESSKSDRDAIESFRTALSSLAFALGTADNDQDNDSGDDVRQEKQNRPLIFIVDELDRCRPTFALEILEKIKHFFSVPNVVFLLSSSLAQLETAVTFAYGAIDARTYLEKFYHLRILFPTGNAGRPDMGSATYLGHLQCNNDIAQIIIRYSYVHSLALRTMERIVAYSKLLEASSIPFVPQIMAVLCILKVVQPNLYSVTRKSKLTFKQLDDAMAFNQWRRPSDPGKTDRITERTKNMWLHALGELEDERTKTEIEQHLVSVCIEANRLIPYFCEKLDSFEFR